MVTNEYVFFYGGVFSQWYRYDMTIDGVTYNCAEQYMMAMKAKTFGDQDALDLIMHYTNPADQKAVGRQIRNFNAEVWNKVARDYVTKANVAKFSDDLKPYLMETGDREIVEASPTDKIWGIGLDIRDQKILDKKNWQGTNWLGECIMEARNILRPRSMAW